MSPHPTSPSRRRTALVTATIVGAVPALTLVPGGTAAADEGPAPSPLTYTVIGDVHTDTVSTFWDDDQLVLDSKADVPEQATRYANEETWFHVDQDAEMTWPDAPAYAFVAPAGSTVWLAPEVQEADVIWPGFSTESVESGTLVDDDITLTLVDVEGPGDVELWNSGAFGEANRLWSSDEAAYTSFTRKVGVHMHANWAFTEPGTYDITVRADAVRASDVEPISDTAVYTFQVGELPEDVDTTTTLDADDTSIFKGNPVNLTAAVAPGAVDGSVEFRDGADVIGHDEVEGGEAVLETVLPVGSHSVTAHFVPLVENLANTSASEPVEIIVKAPTSIHAKLGGFNRKGGQDQLKVTAPRVAKGAPVRLYTFNHGKGKLVQRKVANKRGDVTFVVRDRNGRKVSRYVAKVGATEGTLRDWTNRKQIR